MARRKPEMERESSFTVRKTGSEVSEGDSWLGYFAAHLGSGSNTGFFEPHSVFCKMGLIITHF